MKFEGTKSYIATEDLKVAVNAAITLERPIIVKGEPGTGNIDYDKFLSTLDKIGYDKWVALEYVPTAGTVETLKWMEKWL